MLHTIRLPAGADHLRWVVGLQLALLKGTCQPGTTGADIDLAWITRQFPGATVSEKWLERLAKRKDDVAKSKRTVLELLQVIADFPDDVKLRLENDFDSAHQFLDSFESGVFRRLPGVSQLEADGLYAAALAIRGFLESFYAPGFYDDHGYEIPALNKPATSFHRKGYLVEYLAKNQNVQVCPYCDGSLGSPELDHFYPKAEFPQLACHPLNLIPSCHECNSRENKGSKIPLDKDAADPAAAWFHPFLRSASGAFEIQFERTGNETHAILHSDNPQTQQRLDRLTELVGLRRRWRTALSLKIRATQNKIRKHNSMSGQPESEEALCNKLSEWADNCACEFGLEGFALLEHAFLCSAARRDVATYDELRIYAMGDDVVSGE
ncbi:MAG: hypothetical protein IAE81_24930 [Caldilineaceae bacterium]|nr:hypothetical protein [Caldilineaceae bacterium]